MAPSREIEKLQRRWQENPLGLTFAPLAEAYRKEGMLPDALELLEIGLAQHPNYVPAHIVRGRCFLDGRAGDAAASSFLRVLDLDPENVIALKGLADISERAGHLPEAARWLERLLDFDRSNDDARLQLDRIRSGLPKPEAIPVLAPPAEEAMLPRAEIVELDNDSVEVIRYDPIELSAVVSSEYQPPSDSDALRAAEAMGIVSEPALVAEPEPEPEQPAVVEPIVVAEAAAEIPADTGADVEETESVDADDHAAVAGVEADPELVVTETMAEVFLRQGHRELALAVYTQLAGRTPDDHRIRDAITRLEAELKPAVPPSLPAFAAVLTGGASVRSFFEQLLSASRPRVAEAQLPQGLSLGAVFGEEARAKPVAAVESGPSYDEFYAEEPGPEEEPAGLPSKNDLSAGDDLENFTSWLKGLRR